MVHSYGVFYMVHTIWLNSYGSYNMAHIFKWSISYGSFHMVISKLTWTFMTDHDRLIPDDHEKF